MYGWLNVWKCKINWKKNWKQKEEEKKQIQSDARIMWADMYSSHTLNKIKMKSILWAPLTFPSSTEFEKKKLYT